MFLGGGLKVLPLANRTEKKRYMKAIERIAGLMVLLAMWSVGLLGRAAVDVRQLNPTTVEIVKEGRVLTADFYGPNIVRLFCDPRGGIVREPEARPEAQILVDNPRVEPGKLSVSSSGGVWSIATQAMCLMVDGEGLLSIRNEETGKTVWAEVAAAEFDESKTVLTLAEGSDEYFYGGGVQNGRFSHKGEQIMIENTNNWVDGGVASPTPFYWSTAGYGLLWHTFRPGSYDFGKSQPGTVVLQHGESYLDVFVMVSDGAEALLQDFYQLTGNPVLLPKFGFYEGHLNAYNRDYWTEDEKGSVTFEDGKSYSESQTDNGGVKESLNGEKDNYMFSARAVIDRYLAADMPLGWLLPNDGYGAGYGQTGTLEGNVQNLKEFGDYARGKGVEIGLWTQSDLHPKEGVEALLQRDIVREVRDAGVRVLKTDVAWVGAGYSFGLNGVADVGQIMPYYGSDARPFIISLDGWAGTQRYAGIWSGDQTGGDWEYIRFHIPTFIGSGLSGQPNITSDLDGIFGGKNIPVNVREFQWKTFTPMELNMDGWGSTAKYPQVLGEPATSINRWYLKLKSELMPYTYSIAAEAVEGLPMIRAMFLAESSPYTLGKATQYQYMYGPSLLIAPIYQDTEADGEGNDIRNGIYLPEGRWIDYWNGDVIEGGRIINQYDAPLWKLPVFVRADAIIPMTNANNNPSEIRKDWRAYEIYAHEGAAFSEYDDDGKTQAYLRGDYTRTEVSTKVEKGRLRVAIAPTVGEFEGFEKEKATELRINVSAEPKKVAAKVGGRKVALSKAGSREAFESGENVYYYDAAPNLNRFSTEGSEMARLVVSKNPQLLVRLAKTDVAANEVEVVVDGFEYAPVDKLLSHSGALETPRAELADSCIGVFTLRPTWAAVEGADYYEVEFEDMLYSTIRTTGFTFEGLEAEESYSFKVRAVNGDGVSDWALVSGTTKSDPLEFAVHNIRASASCQDQPGQGVQKMFDFDEKTIWHSRWAEAAGQGGSALPLELTLDLRAVVELDKIEYLPREDGGNGTLLKGTVCYSTDRQNWSEPQAFEWERSGETKTIAFEGAPRARYVKFEVEDAVGGFASGTEMYVYRVAGSEVEIQGDINHDKRIDENDLTSYMNYTGLREGDSDFDYVSSGDINGNGLIDAYDISVVTTELDGGVRNSSDRVRGSLVLSADKQSYQAGEDVLITVAGKGLHYVNGLSFALPYSTDELEYVGVELKNMKDMLNLTYDRLHTNGQKSLYPTFVNVGNNFLLDEGDVELFVIKMRAKKAVKYGLEARDIILVDRNLGTAE